jgi:hypothetical protein
MSKPILCVDFDGVIHSYSSGWKGAAMIPDPPVPGALKWLRKTSEWWDVQIYSSRTSQEGGVAAMREWLLNFAIHEFGDKDAADYFMSLVKFPEQKPAAMLTIDDRAICFDGKWDELDPADLLNFQPWNKRPQLGATGTFSQGSLGPHDDGDIKMAVAHDSKGLVHMNFGKDISWFAVPPEQAIELGKLLMRHAGAKKIEITL